MVTFRPRPTRIAQRLRNEATDAGRCLWSHLSRRQLAGKKFSRQMPVGPFVCDFMSREARLVVEFDGGQHDERAREDAHRTEYIEAEGYRVLRFWNNEVLGNMDGILAAILDALDSAHPLTLSRRREGGS